MQTRFGEMRKRRPRRLILSDQQHVPAEGMRDPPGGRDLLIGTAAGVSMVGILWLAYAASGWCNCRRHAPFIRGSRRFVTDATWRRSSSTCTGMPLASDLLIYLPLALETSAWYSARSLSMTAVSIALAIYGAGTAAARRVHPRHRAVPVLSTAR
jgi:hypothetical protein